MSTATAIIILIVLAVVTVAVVGSLIRTAIDIRKATAARNAAWGTILKAL